MALLKEAFSGRTKIIARALYVGNWCANFLVSSFFLSPTSAITKQGTFWLYAGSGVLALIFFLARVPETKDRSLEQIGQELGAQPEPAGQPS